MISQRHQKPDLILCDLCLQSARPPFRQSDVSFLSDVLGLQMRIYDGIRTCAAASVVLFHVTPTVAFLSLRIGVNDTIKPFQMRFQSWKISHRDSIWCCQNSPTIPFEVESVGTSFPEIDLSAVDAPHFLNLGHHLTEIGSYTGSPSPQLRRYGRRLAADNET